MIETDRVDDHEARQVVFVRRIIAMPGDDIEWRMILQGFKQNSLELRNDFVIVDISILEPSGRCEKVTWLSETVGAAK